MRWNISTPHGPTPIKKNGPTPIEQGARLGEEVGRLRQEVGRLGHMNAELIEAAKKVINTFETEDVYEAIDDLEAVGEEVEEYF